MYTFTVGARSDHIDEYCDRCFNEPSSGVERWRSVGSFALLSFVNTGKLTSANALDRWLGNETEMEVSIWIPIKNLADGAEGWSVPYIFTDSSLAMAGGREIYGFPKQLGWLDVPRMSVAPQSLVCDAVTMTAFNRESTAGRSRVITVSRPDSAPAQFLKPGWPSLAVAATALSDDRGNPAYQLLTDMAAGRMRIFLLKQFRDCQDSISAAYQGMIEVASQVTAFRGGGLLPEDYMVTIADLAGEPITRELGIDTAQQPKIATWLDLDFVISLGRARWEAGVTLGASA
jgi:hypothetical protein